MWTLVDSSEYNITWMDEQTFTLISSCPQVSVPWGTARFPHGRTRYRTRTWRRGRSETSLRAPGEPAGFTSRRLRFWTNVLIKRREDLSEFDYGSLTILSLGETRLAFSKQAYVHIRTYGPQQNNSIFSGKPVLNYRTERNSCWHAFTVWSDQLYQQSFNARTRP